MYTESILTARTPVKLTADLTTVFACIEDWLDENIEYNDVSQPVRITVMPAADGAPDLFEVEIFVSQDDPQKNAMDIFQGFFVPRFLAKDQKAAFQHDIADAATDFDSTLYLFDHGDWTSIDSDDAFHDIIKRFIYSSTGEEQ